MSIAAVLKSFLTVEMVWHKNQHAPIVGIEKAKQIRNAYENYEIDVPSIEYGTRKKVNWDPEIDLSVDIKDIIKNYPVVYKLLNMYPENLFLCGGSILSMFMKTNIADFDIFFCCDDYMQADAILDECLNYINSTYDKVEYSMSQGVISVQNYGGAKIQFIRRVYQSPDQILLGFDFWACQHGYNPKMGYFSIPTGSFALSLKMFPIVTQKRSFSFGHRIRKYYTKMFKILLPGVDKYHSEKINTKDGTLEIKCCGGVFYFQPGIKDANGNSLAVTGCTCKCQATVFRLSDSFPANNSEYISDYESLPQFNRRLLNNDKLFNITYTHLKRENIFNMTPFRMNLYDFWDSWGSWHWQNMNIHAQGRPLPPKLEELMDIFNTPAKRWKTKDPGSQYFGRFNPIMETVEEWYGYSKPKYYIGIHPEVFNILRYMLLKGIWKTMPKDVFNLICLWILKAESNDSFCRLSYI